MIVYYTSTLGIAFIGASYINGCNVHAFTTIPKISRLNNALSHNEARKNRFLTRINESIDPEAAATKTKSPIEEMVAETDVERLEQQNIKDIDLESLLHEVDSILDEDMGSDNRSHQEENILKRMDEFHSQDLQFCSSLAGEERLIDTPPTPVPEYEWIHVGGRKHYTDSPISSSSKPIAIRTTDESNPILDSKSVSVIRKAAEKQWNQNQEQEALASKGSDDDSSKNTNSRFTYQRKGNYEAHLVDLADKIDPKIYDIMKEALTERIYPLVREAFTPQIFANSREENVDFCVYDSLIIRYNSAEALAGIKSNVQDTYTKAKLGAGQPLHRDLGLVSVNIMLNSATEFQGGGTFFENQLLDTLEDPQSTLPKPLKPNGVGQIVAHLSSERHAGAGTTEGTRDIMVLFLTAKHNDNNNKKDRHGPLFERAARLKSKSRAECDECDNERKSLLCRLLHLRLAVEASPNDGEAWHYLGMALKNYSSFLFAQMRDSTKQDDDSPPSRRIMLYGIACMEYALSIIPCDGRLCNNLSLVYSNLEEQTKADSFHSEGKILDYYQRSLMLHKLSDMVGCDVGFDFDTTSLNYGLYLSNKDKFLEAAQVLERFRDVSYINMEVGKVNPIQQRARSDGLRLLHFCEKQL